METLYNQPVVVDNGSGNLKAGFAGDDKPRTYASAVVGRPKYQKLMAGSLLPSSTGVDSSDDTFIGESAQKNRGLLRLTYPMEHGIVTSGLIWKNFGTICLPKSSKFNPRSTLYFSPKHP